jgi:uncharacterized protein (DUF934 family)
MQIIKDGALVDDAIRHLADDEAVVEGCYTVSLARWQKEKDSLSPAGVRLLGADSAAAIAEDLPRLPLVVLEFPAFTDGRNFSHARLLRERYGYQGEIRAYGHFLRDQVHFLSRVGVNAFEPGYEADLPAMLPALQEFSLQYQAAADQKPPVYRLRG